MKRRILVSLVLCLFLVSSVYAQDGSIFGLRNKIFEEAKKIKDLAEAKNIVVVSSLWDTCLITVMQLDAYRGMRDIFNYLKNKNEAKQAVDVLIDWLTQMKATVEMNIRHLEPANLPVEKNLKMHMEVLKAYFSTLQLRIDQELAGLTKPKKTVPK